jgi:hypothetical protein
MITSDAIQQIVAKVTEEAGRDQAQQRGSASASDAERFANAMDGGSDPSAVAAAGGAAGPAQAGGVGQPGAASQAAAPQEGATTAATAAPVEGAAAAPQAALSPGDKILQSMERAAREIEGGFKGMQTALHNPSMAADPQQMMQTMMRVESTMLNIQLASGAEKKGTEGINQLLRNS